MNVCVQRFPPKLHDVERHPQVNRAVPCWGWVLENARGVILFRRNGFHKRQFSLSQSLAWWWRPMVVSAFGDETWKMNANVCIMSVFPLSTWSLFYVFSLFTSWLIVNSLNIQRAPTSADQKSWKFRQEFQQFLPTPTTANQVIIYAL